MLAARLTLPFRYGVAGYGGHGHGTDTFVGDAAELATALADHRGNKDLRSALGTLILSREEDRLQGKHSNPHGIYAEFDSATVSDEDFDALLGIWNALGCSDALSASLPAARTSRTFNPWIGPKYKSEGLDGLKLLMLAESHYGPIGKEYPGLTRLVVRKQGRGARYRLFTATAKLVLGQDHITDAERADFWDRVAFANYIQEFVAPAAAPRTPPSPQAWQQAEAPFLMTLQETRPDALLVLGKGVAARLPPLPDGLAVHVVRHPSVAFSRKKWRPGVEAFLEAASTSR